MSCLHFKTQSKSLKTNYSVNDFKKGSLALSCSKKKLSASLRGTVSKHDGGFYHLHCLHSYRASNKLKSQEKVCKNKDFCGIVMPFPKDKILLQFNQYMKPDKIAYIIHADFEAFIKK